MKINRLLVLLFVLIFVLTLGTLVVRAQQPIPIATPWYVATSTCNPLTAGCPLQVGPMPTPGYVQPAPTWTPLPTIVPLPINTPLPSNVRAGYVQANTMLYRYNMLGQLSLFVPITLTTIGETWTFRLIDATWAEALDGWYAGCLIERWALRLL